MTTRPKRILRVSLFLLFPPLLAAQSLQFATLFGGTCDSANVECDMGGEWHPDTVTSIAIDPAGNIYVAGTSFGEFPLVNAIEGPPPYQIIGMNWSIPFVAKLDPTGTELLYATPIGEPQPGEQLLAIALTVDAAGNTYVTGASPSYGFPTLTGTTPVSQFEQNVSNHVFFIKLDPSGELLLSSQFGGSSVDSGNCITLDSSGAIWIAGTTQSSDFPTTTGSTLSSSQEIFIAKLDPTSGKLTYATLLGQGSSPQLALGPSGDLLLAASTTSSSWPTTHGAIQSSCAGAICADIIALRFRPTNSQIVYATYLGGTGVDTLAGIAADSSGSFYLTGTTASYDFPTSPGAFSTGYQCSVVGADTCGTKAFVAHLNATGTALEYSIYLGGSSTDQGQAIAVDSAGNAYIAGQTNSDDFPVLHAIQPNIISKICRVSGIYGNYCGGAGFVTVLNPQGSALIWSTYLGQYPSIVPPNLENFNGVEAVAVDAHGNVYVGGDDLALNPANVNPPSTNAAGDAAVVKIAPTGQPLTITGLTNAASFAPGLPYGGGLASLFLSGLTGSPSIATGTGAPLLTTLAGFTVKVNGEPAPLLAVATFDGGNGQINFQVPFEQGASGENLSTFLEIDFNGNATFLGTMAVAPGIFTLADGSPAVQHASDYSLVTGLNPITPGETIVIYMTGLGEPGKTGFPAGGPAQNTTIPLPTVTLGDTICKVLYAGATPGFVGLDQINCQTTSSASVSGGPQPLEVFLPVNLFAAPDQTATYSNSVFVEVK